MPRKKIPEKKDLLYRLVYGHLLLSDIQVAQDLRQEDPNPPVWLHVIAGANPAKLEAVQDIAREELAHDLFKMAGIPAEVMV